MSLVPCPDCRRHVRVAERACPFCNAALPAALAQRAIPGATQRMKRAAAFAFTATLSLAGCGDTTTPAPTPTDAATDRNTVNDDGSVMALYGAVPGDASFPDTSTAVDTGTDTGTPDDHGSVFPAYGIAADAGYDAAQADAAGDGGGGVRYGAPPPVDAGDPTDAAGDGGGGVRYGAPPPADWV